jgi:hypothetical protein
MNLHMQERDWQQWLLEGPGSGHPGEWLQDLINAFKAKFIDYCDIHLALQRYCPEQEDYKDLVAKCWREMKAVENIQEHQRVLIHRDKNDERKKQGLIPIENHDSTN